jgi:hypothetical protein
MWELFLPHPVYVKRKKKTWQWWIEIGLWLSVKNGVNGRVFTKIDLITERFVKNSYAESCALLGSE